jgi:VanZ family protein
MMIAIFVASATPGTDLPDFGTWDFDVKKGGHMLGYALLAMSYLHALANSHRITRRLLVLAIVLAGLYAVTDEIHQLFTPGRTSSPIDVAIDTVGAAIGALLWAWIRSVMAMKSLQD